MTENPIPTGDRDDVEGHRARFNGFTDGRPNTENAAPGGSQRLTDRQADHTEGQDARFRTQEAPTSDLHPTG